MSGQREDCSGNHSKFLSVDILILFVISLSKLFLSGFGLIDQTKTKFLVLWGDPNVLFHLE